MMSDKLPTEKQKEMLCEMIAHAFIEIRILGWQNRSLQAADLADAFHNIPKEMYGWGSFSWHIFEGMLRSYQQKYHQEKYSGLCDYLLWLQRIKSEP